MVTIMIDANESPVDRAIVDEVEEAISSAHKEVQQIEKDELGSWKTGVENAWEALKERVATDNATRRAAFEESLKKEGTNREDAANDLGTLKVSLSGSERASEIKVGVDKEKFDWVPGTASRVFTGIRAGNRVVSLCGKTARKDAAGTTERPFLIEDVALVPAGGVAELAMSVPEKLD